MTQTDVLIIGAGPSGTTAAAFLIKAGLSVSIVEKNNFPRFVIGESLLPQCMDIFEEAGLLECIQDFGFQIKNGADFLWKHHTCQFDFSQKISKGWDYTYQVERSLFDQLLARKIESLGAKLLTETEVVSVDFGDKEHLVRVKNKDQTNQQIKAKFILDASGYGRVLAKILDLNLPATLGSKKASFTHLNVKCTDYGFKQNNIAIISHPTQKECWYWLIPLTENKCSLGAISISEHYKKISGDVNEVFIKICNECEHLTWVKPEHIMRPVESISNYTCKVSKMYGKGYALLGNAGDFLDPIFSSGVTIATKSAQLASQLVIQELKGNIVDWDTEYEKLMAKGINAFEIFISAWYEGTLKKIFYNKEQVVSIKEKICSVLAGFAWDNNNSILQDPKRKLNTLVKVCDEL